MAQPKPTLAEAMYREHIAAQRREEAQKEAKAKSREFARELRDLRIKMREGR